jgi:hypothetical protein
MSWRVTIVSTGPAAKSREFDLLENNAKAVDKEFYFVES